ncbi:MAG TPA: hypothetical protein VFY55_07405 [Nitrososphaeraceae archaeon]|jgi:hypothetical protein|nr:hypothetical protein [Nitrososphaeraceae archaeon]
MGRTIPSFRLACMAEELRWRKFRSRLSKDDRKKFDEMFSTSRLYNSACANSARPIVLECVIMSIILNDFKRLTELMKKNRNRNRNRNTVADSHCKETG